MLQSLEFKWTHPEAIHDVDELVSSSEQIWIGSELVLSE